MPAIYWEISALVRVCLIFSLLAPIIVAGHLHMHVLRIIYRRLTKVSAIIIGSDYLETYALFSFVM